MEKENEGGERGELPPPPPPPPRQTRPPPPHPDVGTRTGQGAEPSGAGRGEEKTAPAAREHEPADRLEALGAGRRRGGRRGELTHPARPPQPHTDAGPREAGTPGHTASSPRPPSESRGELASAHGHRGVPRAGAGAGTPGRGGREGKRAAARAPAVPRGRMRREVTPAEGRGREARGAPPRAAVNGKGSEERGGPPPPKDSQKP